VEYCYPSGLEKTLCKWEIHVPLVTKELNIVVLKTTQSVRYASHRTQSSVANWLIGLFVCFGHYVTFIFSLVYVIVMFFESPPLYF
jgi:hypothetical protein